MKPIDCDKTGTVFIQKKPVQPKAVLANQQRADAAAHKTPAGKISDLVSLIQQSSIAMTDDERINQIRHAIQSNTYTIDFDTLADNLTNELFQV